MIEDDFLIIDALTIFISGGGEGGVTSDKNT
jgi:hypothetical protein